MAFLWGFEVYRARGVDRWDAFTWGGRAAVGYAHGYDGQLFYLGLALDERYVEGCLERIGEDYPEEERFQPYRVVSTSRTIASLAR